MRTRRAGRLRHTDSTSPTAVITATVAMSATVVTLATVVRVAASRELLGLGLGLTNKS